MTKNKDQENYSLVGGELPAKSVFCQSLDWQNVLTDRKSWVEKMVSNTLLILNFFTEIQTEFQLRVWKSSEWHFPCQTEKKYTGFRFGPPQVSNDKYSLDLLMLFLFFPEFLIYKKCPRSWLRVEKLSHILHEFETSLMHAFTPGFTYIVL